MQSNQPRMPGTVRICASDDGVRYIFENIRRPGWRSNGLGALIGGVLTLLTSIALVWLVDYILATPPERLPSGASPLTNHYTMLESLVVRFLYWAFLVTGIAASLPFFACFAYTALYGGRCWLSLEGGVVRAGGFFGGEWSSYHIPAKDITSVLLEPLPSSWNSVERGRIRLIGANIQFAGKVIGEVEVGAGYPITELRRIAEDFRRQLKLSES